MTALKLIPAPTPAHALRNLTADELISYAESNSIDPLVLALADRLAEAEGKIMEQAREYEDLENQTAELKESICQLEATIETVHGELYRLCTGQ